MRKQKVLAVLLSITLAFSPFTSIQGFATAKTDMVIDTTISESSVTLTENTVTVSENEKIKDDTELTQEEKDELLERERQAAFIPGYLNAQDELSVPKYQGPLKNSNEPELCTLDTSEILPSSYDSRNVGGVNYVTSVKSQGNYGICWAYATEALAEISLVRQGLKTAGGIDLSERQLAYATYHTAPDPLGNTASDTMTSTAATVSGKTITNNFLYAGGNVSVGMYALMTGKGLASEIEVPYSATESVMTTKPECFSADAHIKNAYMLNATDKNLRKHMIMQYGAVSGMYYDDSQNNAATCYNATNAAYFMSSTVEYGVNHAITIVGWDDSYPATNFNAINRPTTNGAWLCKNSWGSGWGKAGYFYISYEEYSLNQYQFSTSYGFEMDTLDSYDYNYFYGGTVPSNSYASFKKEAVAFDIKSQEVLEGVTIALHSQNEAYSLQFYKNPTEVAGVIQNPETGTPLLTTPITGTTTYSGIYTIELPQTIPVSTGDTISAVVTFNHVDTNNTAEIFLSNDNTLWGFLTSNESDAPGQSFASTGTSWIDASVLQDENGTDLDYTPRMSMLTSSSDVIFTTPSLTATANEKTIELAWTKSYGETGYVIYRSTQSNSIGSEIATIGSGTTLKYTDATVLDNTTYYYTVLAKGSSGDLGYTPKRSITTNFATTATTITILNKDTLNGSFDVLIHAGTAIKSNSTVRLEAWNQGLNDLAGYDTIPISNRQYFLTNVNIAKHAYHYGTYVMQLNVTTNGVTTPALVTTTDMTLPTPTLTATSANGGTTYNINATNVAIQGGVKSVMYAVWSTENGQDDIRYYTGTKTAIGAYNAAVAVANHKSAGTYNV